MGLQKMREDYHHHEYVVALVVVFVKATFNGAQPVVVGAEKFIDGEKLTVTD